MDSVRIVSGAAHGVVTTSGYRVTYVSKAGYTGDDRFIYARSGRDTLLQPTTKTVEVRVIVAGSGR